MDKQKLPIMYSLCIKTTGKNLREIGWEVVVRMHLAQGKVADSCTQSNELSISIKGEEFHDYLSD
jgi:hypothetical protein